MHFQNTANVLDFFRGEFTKLFGDAGIAVTRESYICHTVCDKWLWEAKSSSLQYSQASIGTT